MTDRTPPLIVIGLDAADPDLIERWAGAGYLPTLASLMERGCWGKTGGAELVTEHGVWVSVFSGLSRVQHGYYYTPQLIPGTYDLRTISGRDLNVTPFWFYLGGRGKKIAVVDVPDSRPLQGLDGIQIADWAAHYPRGTPASMPPALLGQVRQIFGPPIRVQERQESTFGEDKRIYRGLMHRIAKKGDLCRRLLARDRFDLIFIVFGESHTAGHQFWKYRADGSPARPPVERTEMGNATRDVYRALDREIGLILSELPANGNVCILSSVGIIDQYPTGGLFDAFCHKLGYQMAASAASVSASPTMVARRLLPQGFRNLLSRLFLSRATQDRLLSEKFRVRTDWRKTRVFALPSTYTSHVRVNLRGREPHGIVESGAPYVELLERFESDLRQLIDPQTNEPAVQDVVWATRVFGDAPPLALPDLFVEWKSGTRWIPRLVHPKVVLEQDRPEFFRGTEHSRNGFFALAGASIRGGGRMDEISVLDLAPTFLALLGESVPGVMTGKPIAGVRQA